MGTGRTERKRVRIVGTSASAPETAPDGQPWTIRGLISAHRLVALAAAAVIALMAAMIAVAAFGPRAGAVTDATTCAQWGSANQNRQNAYARLYISEHGVLAAAGTSPASVITAINNGCVQAFGEDVDDSTTVVQAISGNF